MRRKSLFGPGLDKAERENRRSQAMAYLWSLISLPRSEPNFSIRTTLAYALFFVPAFAIMFLTVHWHLNTSVQAGNAAVAGGVAAGLSHSFIVNYLSAQNLWVTLLTLINLFLWLVIADVAVNALGFGGIF